MRWEVVAQSGSYPPVLSLLFKRRPFGLLNYFGPQCILVNLHPPSFSLWSILVGKLLNIFGYCLGLIVMDPLKAKANYSRVCQLLVDKGGDTLRGALHAKHPPSTLAAALNANRKTLQKIRYSVISPAQWDLLFPTLGMPDSNNFDITLLTILLRNICGLRSPATGWNVMPPLIDTSISANIARIKIFRNEVYGHTPSAQLDDTKFERLWKEISQPLIKLGIPQQDIDELKVAPLSSEEESYIEKLKEWKELEGNLLSKLDDVEREVKGVRNEMFKLRKTVGNVNPSQIDQLAKFDFTGKIDDLNKKFYDGTRLWFFEKLSSWFHDETSKVMILTAGPGVGKSVLSAKVCEQYQQRGQLAGCHFCDFRNSDYSNPKRILQSLASRMCDNVEGFRDKLTDVLQREHSRDSLSDAFRVFLNDPLHALDRHEPMLIVVDALDESKVDDKSEFLELISDEFSELPKWVKILISSRPDLQVRKKLLHLNPFEILPNDEHHNLDLELFVRYRFPNISEDYINSIVSMCEGSFLYAYFLTNELKENYLGIEPNLSEYVAKGISGFYEKQFKRLKVRLLRLKPVAGPSIFKSFVNVVAASREPLPIKFLFACMSVSSEEFEIREAIIGIMSEILPIYDDCLTVYHKSLWDWLTLDGYDEHAFAGNAADGTKRLCHACKSIYHDIDSLTSVSEFDISSEKRYALEYGGKYLVNVGKTEDFHWLGHVGLNYLKIKFCENLNVDFFNILRVYKSELPDDLFWSFIQLHAFSTLYSRDFSAKNEEFYLQYVANGHFYFAENTFNRDTARDILEKTNTIWFEEVANENNPTFEIVSSAVSGGELNSISLSPDHNLLACRRGQIVEVFRLPSLTMIFELEVSCPEQYPTFPTFSPDSSYFLCNSVRSCVTISEKKEVPFIPHGPEEITLCSFSSCGTKLVTLQPNSDSGSHWDIRSIKVWDVRKKDILAEFATWVPRDRFDDYFHQTHSCFFSNCNSYVLVRVLTVGLKYFHIVDSTECESLDKCSNSCLTYENDYHVISLYSYTDTFISISQYGISHFHLPTGEIVLNSSQYCSKPFIWKGKKCVISQYYSKNIFTLEVYDFINKEIVDMFQISSLPCYTVVTYLSNLDAKNFLVGLGRGQVFILSFEPSSESFVAPVVNHADVTDFELSPDNLYAACCYKNCVLTISSVVHGETLQTVDLRQTPKRCWWSELYLWVVFEDLVAKFPYNPRQGNVVGNYVEECAIDCKDVLKFEKGVLVIRDKLNKMSILKICNGKLCPEQVPIESNFLGSSCTVSSDGCAIFFYFRHRYQLWEKECENRWELSRTGSICSFGSIIRSWLTGAKCSRRALCITTPDDYFEDENRFLVSTDLENCTQVAVHDLGCFEQFGGAICVESSVLIIYAHRFIYVFKASDGKLITSFSLRQFPGFHNASFFFLAKRSFLLLVEARHTKYLKIHNIENYYLT